MQLYPDKMKVNLIVPCGGSGKRCGLDHNKLFEPIMGEPMIFHTLTPFVNNERISKIILPCSIEDINKFNEIIKQFGDDGRIITIAGGKTRSESVYNATQYIDKDCNIVLIHDGARPYVKAQLIDNVIDSVITHGSAVAAIMVTDTLSYADDNNQIIGYPNRDKCYRIQTPQGFIAKELIAAYRNANQDGIISKFTDESSLMQYYGSSPYIVDGDDDNIKITFNTDFHRVCGYNYRIGCGYDTHRLVEGRQLIIGGIQVEHDKGLLGHSDADVLIHAIMDALLACADMRDIGVLFPDNSQEYKNIDSKILLTEVNEILQRKHLIIINISAVIMAQKPKLSHYIPLMADCMASILNISPNDINISATTTEGLGFIGREEGIGVRCVALCKYNESK